jgi:3-isopropylmalate dehydrogenase
MMLDHLGEEAAGKAIEAAAMEVTGKHIKSLAAGQMGMSTTGVGDLVAKLVA